MPEPMLEKGIWVCPICGFKAMSKKVILAHMEREHPEAFEEKPKEEDKPVEKEEKRGNTKNKKGSVSKRKFKLGNTEIRLWDYEYVEVKDHRGWQMFANRNYLTSLHKRKVKVKLVSGEEFSGILKARDPYFIALILDNGERIYLNKAHVMWIKPVVENGGD